MYLLSSIDIAVCSSLGDSKTFKAAVLNIMLWVPQGEIHKCVQVCVCVCVRAPRKVAVNRCQGRHRHAHVYLELKDRGLQSGIFNLAA